MSQIIQSIFKTFCPPLPEPCPPLPEPIEKITIVDRTIEIPAVCPEQNFLELKIMAVAIGTFAFMGLILAKRVFFRFFKLKAIQSSVAIIKADKEAQTFANIIADNTTQTTAAIINDDATQTTADVIKADQDTQTIIEITAEKTSSQEEKDIVETSKLKNPIESYIDQPVALKNTPEASSKDLIEKTLELEEEKRPLIISNIRSIANSILSSMTKERSIRYFNLGGSFGVEIDCSKLMDQEVQKILKILNQQYLDVNNISFIGLAHSGSPFANELAAFKKLRTISFIDCEHLDQDEIILLTQRITNIKVIELLGKTSYFLLKNFNTLVITYPDGSSNKEMLLTQFYDKVKTHLIQKPWDEFCFKAFLNDLSKNSCFFVFYTPTILCLSKDTIGVCTDEICAILISFFNQQEANIVALDFSKSDITIACLQGGVGLPLKDLNLSHLENLNNDHFDLLSFFPLEKLDCSYSSINDKGLLKLLKVKNLKYLHLNGCINLDIKKLSYFTSILEQIKLEYIPDINLKIIEEMTSAASLGKPFCVVVSSNYNTKIVYFKKIASKQGPSINDQMMALLQNIPGPISEICFPEGSSLFNEDLKRLLSCNNLNLTRFSCKKIKIISATSSSASVYSLDTFKDFFLKDFLIKWPNLTQFLLQELTIKISREDEKIAIEVNIEKFNDHNFLLMLNFLSGCSSIDHLSISTPYDDILLPGITKLTESITIRQLTLDSNALSIGALQDFDQQPKEEIKSLIRAIPDIKIYSYILTSDIISLFTPWKFKSQKPADVDELRIGDTGNNKEVRITFESTSPLPSKKTKKTTAVMLIKSRL